MAPKERDLFSDLERLRLSLEANVDKLSKALRHWQTWEAEYEGLKEEVEAFKSDPSRSNLVKIGQEYGGDLVNEKEVNDILGLSNPNAACRTRPQIISILSNRIRYVQQNVSTISKQLDAANEKLAKTMIVQQPDLETEDGLPLTEIREELDDDGNVISSSLSRPGQETERVLEALKEAGVHSIADGKATPDKQPSKDGPSEPSDPSKDTSPIESKLESQPNPKPEPKPESQPNPKPDSKPEPEPQKPAPDVQMQDSPKAFEPPKSRQGPPPFGDAAYAYTGGDRIIELNEFDEEIGSRPIIRPEESPADAAMRREMLQYHLNQNGAIVAELDLMDGSDDEDEDDIDLEDLSDYDEQDDEDEEMEDEHGRSLRREVSDKVHREMQELERRLNAGMVENLGPRPLDARDAKRLVVKPDDEVEKNSQNLNINHHDNASEDRMDIDRERKVRFADDLDISPAPKSTTAGATPSAPAQEPRPPVYSDSVVERTGPAASSPSAPGSKPAKVSRFKSARNASASEDSSTQQPTMASDVHERIEDTSRNQPPVAPGDSDDLDPALHRREIAQEYYRMRNNMIHAQPDGFKPNVMEQENPLYEEKDGKAKRVSRFKAARIASQAPEN